MSRKILCCESVKREKRERKEWQAKLAGMEIALTLGCLLLLGSFLGPGTLFWVRCGYTSLRMVVISKPTPVHRMYRPANSGCRPEKGHSTKWDPAFQSYAVLPHMHEDFAVRIKILRGAAHHNNRQEQGKMAASGRSKSRTHSFRPWRPLLARCSYLFV